MTSESFHNGYSKIYKGNRQVTEKYDNPFHPALSTGFVPRELSIREGRYEVQYATILMR